MHAVTHPWTTHTYRLIISCYATRGEQLANQPRAPITKRSTKFMRAIITFSGHQEVGSYKWNGFRERIVEFPSSLRPSKTSLSAIIKPTSTFLREMSFAKQRACIIGLWAPFTGRFVRHPSTSPFIIFNYYVLATTIRAARVEQAYTLIAYFLWNCLNIKRHFLAIIREYTFVMDDVLSSLSRLIDIWSYPSRGACEGKRWSYANQIVIFFPLLSKWACN